MSLRVRDCEALKTVWDCFQKLNKRQHKNLGPKELVLLQEEELDGALRERLLQHRTCRNGIAQCYKNAYGLTHTHIRTHVHTNTHITL